MIICEYNKCTGCAACANACPHDCISLLEDDYGELHPVVDESKCKKCKRCIFSCPNNRSLDYFFPTKCYAAWMTDSEKRKTCASGGIGSAMAEYVVNNLFGVVFGTAYNSDFLPVTTYAENFEGVECFKGSKYAHSKVENDTFRRIKIFLNEGKFVLYIATPCQIAGLLSFLNKKYENLLCVDLICHGVSPTSYFKEEIESLCKKHKISNLTNVRFRGNDYVYRNRLLTKLIGRDTNDYALTLWDKSGRRFHAPWNTNYYYFGFLEGISLRENCFTCNYARPERISDITIGDFIGLDWHFLNSNGQEKMSSVTINTIQGNKFFERFITEYNSIQVLEREYAERLKYRPSMLEPSKKHSLNKAFRDAIKNEGYMKGSRRVLKWIMLKNSFLTKMNCMTVLYKKIKWKVVRR